MRKAIKIFLFILSLGIIIFLFSESGFDLSSQIKAQFPEILDSIDLSNLVADVDLKARKSILYMSEWPEVVEEDKVLFIPSTGIGTIYICPKVTSLDEVKPTCQDKIVINVGETKNGIAVDTTIYNDQEYYLVFGVTGTGGGEVIPAIIDFDPDTLNLKSKGKCVTAYIELPIGHGYSVDDINLESITLNNQIQAETKPTGIGDYDSDNIPDLMVKFNRSAVQNILQIGEKIKITISGNLIDGRLFEGVDFIRVISP